MGARPFALHFDVEPMGLSDWFSDTQGVANQYLDLLQNISVSKGNLLDLVVDTSIGFNFQNITRSGTTKLFYQWVLDYVDIVMLMCYRNVLEGPNGILSLAKPSVDYATKIGKKVIVGVETANVDPDYITFYGMDTTYLESILGQVNATFNNQSGFLGVAVHDWTAYKNLRQTIASGDCINKGLFLWQAEVAYNVSLQDSYFSFARTHCVTTTYLESEDLINSNLQSLRDFWHVSQSYGMNMQFLFGYALWAYTYNHPYVLSLVNRTKELVEGLPTTKPTLPSSTQ